MKPSTPPTRQKWHRILALGTLLVGSSCIILFTFSGPGGEASNLRAAGRAPGNEASNLQAAGRAKGCQANALRKYHFEPHDRWVNENIVKNETNGVFLDAGVLCPTGCSYSYFFEKELCWTGICIDARDEVYADTLKTRSCAAYHGALCNHSGRDTFWSLDGPNASGYSGLLSSLRKPHKALIDKNVKSGLWTLKEAPVFCYTLDKMSSDNGISKIDLLTLDVEGAELEVLKQTLESGNVKIRAVVAETGEPEMLDALMLSHGYRYIGKVGFDRGYVLPE